MKQEARLAGVPYVAFTINLHAYITKYIQACIHSILICCTPVLKASYAKLEPTIIMFLKLPIMLLSGAPKSSLLCSKLCLTV